MEKREEERIEIELLELQLTGGIKFLHNLLFYEMDNNNSRAWIL